MFKNASNVMIGAVCLALIALRFWRVADSCLWFDEIFSVHAATHSWDSILSFIALDLIHPPLFYVLLKLWIGVGGESVLWLRSFSVVFSILAIFPFIALCRQLRLSPAVQILALFLVAVNGSLIKYAQEVRMYSLLFCFSLLSTWLFSRFLNKGKGFIPLVLINILLVYTHYFGWFVVLSEVAATALFQRAKLRSILAMSGLIFAGFAPWAYYVWQASKTGSGLNQNIGWMSRPGLRAVSQFVLSLIEPFYFQASNADPVSIFRVSIAVLLIGGTALALYFAKWNKQNEAERQMLKLVSLFVGVPVFAAFALSWLLPYSIWGTRHLIIVFAPALIILAIAITGNSSPFLRTAGITLLLLFSGYGFVLTSIRETPVYSWCWWLQPEVFTHQAEPGNIYVFEDLAAYHFWYSLDRQGQTAREVIKVTDVDGVWEDRAYFLPRGFDAVRSIRAADITEPSLFLVFRTKRFDETGQPLKTFIEMGYQIKGRQIYKTTAEETIFVHLYK